MAAKKTAILFFRLKSLPEDRAHLRIKFKKAIFKRFLLDSSASKASEKCCMNISGAFS